MISSLHIHDANIIITLIADYSGSNANFFNPENTIIINLLITFESMMELIKNPLII